jgi:GTP-binding protein
VDDPKHDPRTAEAHSLGFPDVIGISALHKRNLGELLDRIVELLPEDREVRSEEEIRVSIVGRPNVGKSSLLNRLTKEERSLVSSLAGTTRDPVDTPAVLEGRNFRLIDTAGLRKKGRMTTSVEYYSFVRTLAAIDRSDVALLVMDAGEPCTDSDKKIAAHIVEKGRGLVLLLNKWDLLPKKDELGGKTLKKIRETMPFLSWAPVLFLSALSGRGIQKIAETAAGVFENRRRRIPTNALNRLMRDVLVFDRLPSNKRGKTLKVYYCLQSDVEPPAFVFFVNDPGIVDSAFENHIQKALRALGDTAGCNFGGSPLRIYWRARS